MPTVNVQNSWMSLLTNAVARRVDTSPYSISSSDIVIMADSDGGDLVQNLPAGVNGKAYRITNCGTAGHTVTINPDGAELLNGLNAAIILQDGESLTVVYETTEGWRSENSFNWYKKVGDIDLVVTTSAEFEACGDPAYADKNVLVMANPITLTKPYVAPEGQKLISGGTLQNPIVVNGNFAITSGSSDESGDVTSADWNSGTRTFTFSGAPAPPVDATNLYVHFNGQLGSVASTTGTTIVLDASPNVSGSVKAGSRDKVVWTRNPLVNFAMTGNWKFTGTGYNFDLEGSYGLDFSGFHGIMSGRCNFISAYIRDMGIFEWTNDNFNCAADANILLLYRTTVDRGAVIARSVVANDAQSHSLIVSNYWVDGNINAYIIGCANVGAGTFRGIYIAGTINDLVLSGIDKNNDTASSINASVETTTLV